MGTQATVCISQVLIADFLHDGLFTFRQGQQIFSEFWCCFFFFKLPYTLCPTHQYALVASLKVSADFIVKKSVLTARLQHLSELPA